MKIQDTPLNLNVWDMFTLKSYLFFIYDENVTEYPVFYLATL